MLLRHMGQGVETAHDGIEALALSLRRGMTSACSTSGCRGSTVTRWPPASNAGFNEHVVKPLTAETLQRLLASAAVSIDPGNNPTAGGRSRAD